MLIELFYSSLQPLSLAMAFSLHLQYLLTLFELAFYFYFCVCAHVYLPHVCVCPTNLKRVSYPWSWSYRQWVLGVLLGSFGRTEFLFVYIFWVKVSLYISDWLETWFVDQTGLQLTNICLPLDTPTPSWRCVPPQLVTSLCAEQSYLFGLPVYFGSYLLCSFSVRDHLPCKSFPSS